jgi:hypothetical protein
VKRKKLSRFTSVIRTSGSRPNAFYSSIAA